MGGMTTKKTKTSSTEKSRYRKLSSLAKKGDIEWLKSKKCPKCNTAGHLMMSPGGEHPNERIVCLQCGYRFMIPGRPRKKR